MYFSRSMRVYVGLTMLSASTKFRFPCFLLVSRVWEISSGIGPCFPLAGGLCKFYANAGGTRPTQRKLLLVQYKQQANPLLSLRNYTPPVISRNDKNKQLTIIKPMELALTARNTLLQYKIIGTLKFVKMAPSSI